MEMEVAIGARAIALLTNKELDNKDIFKSTIEENYTPLHISQSKVLQFGLHCRSFWNKHVAELHNNGDTRNGVERDTDQWKKLIYDGLAPFTPDSDIVKDGVDIKLLLMGCYVKQFVNKHLCYGFPNADVITEIAAFIGDQSCLEIGAGNGLWSRLLTSEGIKVTATDAFDMHLHSHGRDQKGIFYPVIKAKADKAVVSYPSGCLLMVWPDGYEFPSKFKGNKVIYVGEEEDGCTSGHPPESTWKLESTLTLPQFPFINDKVYLYIRK